MGLNLEQREMMDRAIKDAPFKQMIIWAWWSIFYPRKSNKLIKCVEVGMHWRVSFEIAKNV